MKPNVTNPPGSWLFELAVDPLTGETTPRIKLSWGEKRESYVWTHLTFEEARRAGIWLLRKAEEHERHTLDLPPLPDFPGEPQT